MLKRVGLIALALIGAASASAQLSISIGIRETGFAGGADNGIGGNGGSSGGIEFVNRDAQTLVMDGTWQQFTFTMSTATLIAFAGTSANGVLDGSYGVLEHIRILNAGGHTAPLKLWIDDVANTITPVGSGPQTTTFGSFEGFADNTEVIFQEPRFSSSTTGNLALTPNTSGVDNTVAHSGSASDRIEFQFLDAVPTRWVRLTTFNTPNSPNPIVRFDQSSVVSFWMRSEALVPEPATLGILGLGVAPLLRRRKK